MSASIQPQIPPFEFTKRKRWADLLVTELADANLFILSSDCRILYCGAAVTELLGWREAELVDHEFGDIVNTDDVNIFRSAFDDSIRHGTEIITYVRLRGNSPATTYPFSPVKEILFEIKGYPKTASQGSVGDPAQFFFALAKPYLSRNTAMLNTVLELQLENELLQRKLRSLKTKLHGNALWFTPSVSNNGSGELYQYYSSIGGGNIYESTSAGAGRSDIVNGSSVMAMNIDDHHPEELEEGSKKKKPKRSHAPEQYVCVTCGRTDSPEWRKGPLGPKTLCNACGLRWAKQNRTKNDSDAPGPPDDSTLL